MQQIIELNCPGCGARVSTGQKECDWCHKPIVITTFNSVNSMPLPEISKYAKTYSQALQDNPNNQELNKSVAMCYLKLKMYEKAMIAFDKAIEDNFDDSELFFYAAVSQLSGKRPFLLQKKNVDKALEYLQSATMIESRGIYYYVMAYISYDYYCLKKLRSTPSYEEHMQNALQWEVPQADIMQAFSLLGTNVPDALVI